MKILVEEKEGWRVNVFREETIFLNSEPDRGVLYIYLSRHIVTSAGLIFFRYEASIYIHYVYLRLV